MKAEAGRLKGPSVVEMVEMLDEQGIVSYFRSALGHLALGAKAEFAPDIKISRTFWPSLKMGNRRGVAIDSSAEQVKADFRLKAACKVFELLLYSERNLDVLGELAWRWLNENTVVAPGKSLTAGIKQAPKFSPLSVALSLSFFELLGGNSNSASRLKTLVDGAVKKLEVEFLSGDVILVHYFANDQDLDENSRVAFRKLFMEYDTIGKTKPEYSGKWDSESWHGLRDCIDSFSCDDGENVADLTGLLCRNLLARRDLSREQLEKWSSFFLALKSRTVGGSRRYGNFCLQFWGLAKACNVYRNRLLHPETKDETVLASMYHVFEWVHRDIGEYVESRRTEGDGHAQCQTIELREYNPKFKRVFFLLSDQLSADQDLQEILKIRYGLDLSAPNPFGQQDEDVGVAEETSS